MKVSIVTPSYNRGYCIEKTILSVLNQSYKDIEYIIIDGGSTDDTLPILEKYAAQGMLRYISEADRGMYDAINKGLTIASGDILAYLNSDDLYFPWTVEKVADHFLRNMNTDFVYGDTLVLDKKTGNIHPNVYPHFSKLWLRSGAIIPQPTVFLRKKCFSMIGGFQKEVDLIADCEYWLRGIEEGFTFRKIDEFMAIEVNHEDTLREHYKEKILQEKRILQASYSSLGTRNSILRSSILRSKYAAKEMYALYFILKSRFKMRSGKWSSLISNYQVKCDIANYMRKKFVRSTRKVWDVEIETYINSLI